MGRALLVLIWVASAARLEHWKGTGHQYEPDMHWTIDLVFDPEAAVGHRAGSIAYPSLGCSGELVREADEDGTIVLREHITTNPDHVCVDGGTMLLPQSRGKTFVWRWRWPGTTQQAADATLHR